MPGGNYLDDTIRPHWPSSSACRSPRQGYVSGLGGDGLGGAAPDDWYSVNVQAGQSLYLQSSTPSDQGGQFPNTASLEICLYDTYGNLVATGTKMADGRNESLFFNAPVSGEYHIEITEDPGGAGEYFLSVNTASYPSGGITGQVYNDLNGSGTSSRATPACKAGKSTSSTRTTTSSPRTSPTPTATSTSRGSIPAPTPSRSSCNPAGPRPRRPLRARSP